MKPDFVIHNNSVEVNTDIAILEPYIALVNHSPSNDKLSPIKLKAEAFLSYLSKVNLFCNFNNLLHLAHMFDFKDYIQKIKIIK